MVGISYDQKPYRKAMIETWGATVHRSPSDLTEAGRSQAEHDSGSLGIAISEAVEVAAGSEDTNYSLGSVLNHVCLHQTVIGQECIAQMELAGEAPDVVIGCVGGGSNFAGVAYPFLRQKLQHQRVALGFACGAPRIKTRFVAAEPAACPTLTRGRYAYDFGDTVGMTPLMPMYTLGHDFVPPPVHAGGLRYHGDAPSLSALVKEELVEAKAIAQTAAFEAAVRFARCEGIIPGPEPAHAIRAVFDEAEAAKQAGEERVILFNLSGHGHFDMSAYAAYFAGELRGSRDARRGALRGARAPARGARARLNPPPRQHDEHAAIRRGDEAADVSGTSLSHRDSGPTGERSGRRPGLERERADRRVHRRLQHGRGHQRGSGLGVQRRAGRRSLPRD